MVTMHHTLRLARATVLTVAMVSVIALGSSEPVPGPVTYHPFCTVEGTVNDTVQRVRWLGSPWIQARVNVDTVNEQDRDIPPGAQKGECRVMDGETAKVYLSNTDVTGGDRVRGVAHYEETRLVQGVFVRNVTIQR